MPWCPACKNEYYDTVKKCPECGCELVENLDEVIECERLIEGEKEDIEKIFSFLHYNDLMSVTIDYQEESDDYLLSCSMEESKKATSLIRVYLQQQEEMPEQEETENAQQGLLDDEEDMLQFVAMQENESVIYKNNAERAEDNKSSAYILLVVGGVGLIVDILLFAGIISMPLQNSKYMILSVMGAMFFLFFVMGIVSFKNSKNYKKKAEEEADLTNDITKWCKENISEVTIDQNLFWENEENMGNEQKYFKRSDKIKQLLNEQFQNLDPAYLDNFVDEYYPEIFPE